ncbi:MAG: 5-(carboxyamino)imidazole ribonucleotide synthase [Pantanalinema sp. GBBB05]|nr:5-(carboxyamino)imidazole ribonucleotide synthase [Pantanalinema sp. GBBB05]
MQRVGVIGGGQLAWMMAGAATKLGVELVVQTPATSDPAVAIAADTVLAPVADAAATAQLAAQTEVITFENEFVDLVALSALADRGVCFRPQLSVLQPLLDKYDQRSYLRNLGLPTPRFWALDLSGGGDGRDEDVSWSFPIVLKTRRHGYDGQGTFILRSEAEFQATLERLPNVPLLVEEFVPFERELAAIAARSVNGEIALYPIVETQQEQQVCRRVFAPAAVSPAVVMQIEAIVRTLLTSLDAVGIFGIELFLTPDDKVLVNEIAPRTHNSGHFTLDACDTSQFEQHLRAVCGLPLGDPVMRSPAAVMVNLLGYEQSQSDYLSKRQQLAALPGSQVHWYGKTESRPGRKLGHVTVLLPDTDRQLAEQMATTIESIWYMP